MLPVGSGQVTKISTSSIFGHYAWCSMQILLWPSSLDVLAINDSGAVTFAEGAQAGGGASGHECMSSRRRP